MLDRSSCLHIPQFDFYLYYYFYTCFCDVSHEGLLYRYRLAQLISFWVSIIYVYLFCTIISFREDKHLYRLRRGYAVYPQQLTCKLRYHGKYEILYCMK